MDKIHFPYRSDSTAGSSTVSMGTKSLFVFVTNTTCNEHDYGI